MKTNTEKKKAQFSFEFIVIIAIATIILAISLASVKIIQRRSTDMSAIVHSRNAVSTLANAVDLVASQGCPSRKTVEIYIPPEVSLSQSYIGSSSGGIGNIINLHVVTPYGEEDVYAYTTAEINGSLPSTKGYHSLVVQNECSYITIGKPSAITVPSLLSVVVVAPVIRTYVSVENIGDISLYGVKIGPDKSLSGFLSDTSEQNIFIGEKKKFYIDITKGEYPSGTYKGNLVIKTSSSAIGTLPALITIIDYDEYAENFCNQYPTICTDYPELSCTNCEELFERIPHHMDISSEIFITENRILNLTAIVLSQDNLPVPGLIGLLSPVDDQYGNTAYSGVDIFIDNLQGTYTYPFVIKGNLTAGRHYTTKITLSNQNISLIKSRGFYVTPLDRQFYIYTNRHIYNPGEYIYFRAGIIDSECNPDKNWNITMTGRYLIINGSTVNGTWSGSGDMFQLVYNDSTHEYTGYFSPDISGSQLYSFIAEYNGETIYRNVSVYYGSDYLENPVKDISVSINPYWALALWKYRRAIIFENKYRFSSDSYPVSVELYFENQTVRNCTTELRLFDRDKEIPIQIDKEIYNSGYCIYAKISALIELRPYRNKTYHLYYGNPNASPPVYTNIDVSYSPNQISIATKNSTYIFKKTGGLDSCLINGIEVCKDENLQLETKQIQNIAFPYIIGPIYTKFSLTWVPSGTLRVQDNITIYNTSFLFIDRKIWSKQDISPSAIEIAKLKLDSTCFDKEIVDSYLRDWTASNCGNPPASYIAGGYNSTSSLAVFLIQDIPEIHGNSYISSLDFCSKIDGDTLISSAGGAGNIFFARGEEHAVYLRFWLFAGNISHNSYIFPMANSLWKNNPIIHIGYQETYNSGSDIWDYTHPLETIISLYDYQNMPYVESKTLKLSALINSSGFNVLDKDFSGNTDNGYITTYFILSDFEDVTEMSYIYASTTQDTKTITTSKAIIASNISGSTDGPFKNRVLLHDTEKFTNSFENLPATSLWWNPQWNYRYCFVFNIQDIKRYNYPVELVINFTSILKDNNILETFDNNSIRVIESDEDYSPLYEIPSQFVESTDYDQIKNAVGSIYWIANGTSVSNRYYCIYFDTVENGIKPIPNYTTDIKTESSAGDEWVENAVYKIVYKYNGTPQFRDCYINEITGKEYCYNIYSYRPEDPATTINLIKKVFEGPVAIRYKVIWNYNNGWYTNDTITYFSITPVIKWERTRYTDITQSGNFRIINGNFRYDQGFDTEIYDSGQSRTIGSSCQLPTAEKYSVICDIDDTAGCTGIFYISSVAYGLSTISDTGFCATTGYPVYPLYFYTDLDIEAGIENRIDYLFYLYYSKTNSTSEIEDNYTAMTIPTSINNPQFSRKSDIISGSTVRIYYKPFKTDYTYSILKFNVSDIRDENGVSYICTDNCNSSQIRYCKFFKCSHLEASTIGLWEFEDSGDKIAHDSSEMGNHGTKYGGVSCRESGFSGYSCYFDGINDFINILSSPDYLIESGSIELWFKPYTLTGKQALISKDANGINKGDFTIYLDNRYLYAVFATNSSEILLESPVELSPNKWYHVAFTFGSNGLKLYLNGTLVDSDSYSGGIYPNSETIIIGASSQYRTAGTLDSITDHFNGWIDIVRISSVQKNTFPYLPECKTDISSHKTEYGLTCDIILGRTIPDHSYAIYIEGKRNNTTLVKKTVVANVSYEFASDMPYQLNSHTEGTYFSNERIDIYSRLSTYKNISITDWNLYIENCSVADNDGNIYKLNPIRCKFAQIYDYYLLQLYPSDIINYTPDKTYYFIIKANTSTQFHYPIYDTVSLKIRHVPSSSLPGIIDISASDNIVCAGDNSCEITTLILDIRTVSGLPLPNVTPVVYLLEYCPTQTSNIYQLTAFIYQNNIYRYSGSIDLENFELKREDGCSYILRATVKSGATTLIDDETITAIAYKFPNTTMFISCTNTSTVKTDDIILINTTAITTWNILKPSWTSQITSISNITDSSTTPIPYIKINNTPINISDIPVQEGKQYLLNLESSHPSSSSVISHIFLLIKPFYPDNISLVADNINYLQSDIATFTLNITDSVENMFIPGATVYIDELKSSTGDIIDISTIDIFFIEKTDKYEKVLDLGLLPLESGKTYYIVVKAILNNTALFDTTTFNII